MSETTITAPATPTAEEIQAQTKLAMDSMFGAPPPKEEVEEVVETPPIETPPPAIPVTPAVTPAPVVEKTEAEKQQELIDKTAEAVANRMKPAAPAVTPAPATAAAPEMGTEDKADYEVLLKLSESDPAYAEKADQFAKFVTASYAYQDQWLAAHPGQEFNADAEEHTAWYEANQRITPDDIKSAREELRITEISERRMAPMMEKLAMKEREEAIQQAVPVVAEIFEKQITKLVEMVDPAMVEHLKDDKGVIRLTDEAQQKAIAADPIAARELVKIVQSVSPMIMALEKTAIPALDYRLRTTPWKNEKGEVQPPDPLHLEIDEFRKQAEAAVMAKPEAERSVGGKPFVTVETYQEEMARIYHTTAPRERKAAMDRYSESVAMVSIDEIETKILEHFSGAAKKIIGEINSAAEKKFKPSITTAQATLVPVPSIHAAGNNKPKSPSLGAQTPVVTTPAAGAAEQKNMAQQATKNMFGK